MEETATATTAIKATSLPWKTRLSLLLVSTVTDASRRRDGTVNRTLIKLLTNRDPPNPKPIDGVTTSDVTVDPSRKLWFRVFFPTDAPSDDPLPVVVFFHGGGFVYLHADSRAYIAVCRRFARTIPAILLSVDYRLAPENRYPAQYEDGFDVLKFLDEKPRSEIPLPHNADLSRCFLAGDSAGANIAHHIAKRAEEFQQLKVIGLVSIQPFFGGEERTEAEMRLTQLVSIERTDWMWKAFLPEEGADRDHEAANVSGPRAEEDIRKIEKFPATVVFVGGQDALQDWQRRYYEGLKKSGKEAYMVEYPNMVHAFYTFPELPESGQLISQVKDFIHNPSSPPPATPSSRSN